MPEKPDRVRNRKKLGSRGGRASKLDKAGHKDCHTVELWDQPALAVRYEATVLVAAINEWP
ncbi:hypothetical protein [Streptomyces ardesiacus]|uniref:hypothetical protein n=1 Tax=Streptomyces ardesiacus TaxID=285564 RepID=UPI0036EF4F11